MTAARFIIGDTRDVTASLPDGSVDLVLTSPPFLALRSYLPADHPDKHREIGSEATPADFLDVLLDLTEEWRRVLKPTGSICVELGDSYAGSGGDGGDTRPDSGSFANRKKIEAAQANGIAKIKRSGPGWPQDKSLCGIPTLFTWSLAYGRNLLRPERTIEPWIVRNLVVWARTNPMVGQLGDKFRPGSSFMTVACKGPQRYFDHESVRVITDDHDGPPLDWWVIPGSNYKGAHSAVWPPALCVTPVKAMCPPGGVVLDPFAGSGTTLAVATGHGRDAIGIDIDERNADLAIERVGPMFLTVERHGKEAA